MSAAGHTTVEQALVGGPQSGRMANERHLIVEPPEEYEYAPTNMDVHGTQPN